MSSEAGGGGAEEGGFGRRGCRLQMLLQARPISAKGSAAHTPRRPRPS